MAATLIPNAKNVFPDCKIQDVLRNGAWTKIRETYHMRVGAWTRLCPCNLENASQAQGIWPSANTLTPTQNKYLSNHI